MRRRAPPICAELSPSAWFGRDSATVVFAALLMPLGVGKPVVRSNAVHLRRNGMRLAAVTIRRRDRVLLRAIGCCCGAPVEPRLLQLAEHVAHEAAERHRRQRHARRRPRTLSIASSSSARALVALRRIDRERLHHDRLERLRIALDEPRRPHDIAGDDAVHRVEVAVGAEAAMLRRDLVEDDAEREHVAAAIDVAAAALLRRHVRELALDDAGLRLDASAPSPSRCRSRAASPRRRSRS